jgi:hypothetical protein
MKLEEEVIQTNTIQTIFFFDLIHYSTEKKQQTDTNNDIHL